jgi:hypothetical protein
LIGPSERWPLHYRFTTAAARHVLPAVSIAVISRAGYEEL